MEVYKFKRTYTHFKQALKLLYFLKVCAHCPSDFIHNIVAFKVNTIIYYARLLYASIILEI